MGGEENCSSLPVCSSFGGRGDRRGGGGGGGGVGEEKAAGRRPLVASEISPLTEVVAAAGDELSGPTCEHGNS